MSYPLCRQPKILDVLTPNSSDCAAHFGHVPNFGNTVDGAFTGRSKDDDKIILVRVHTRACARARAHARTHACTHARTRVRAHARAHAVSSLRDSPTPDPGRFRSPNLNAGGSRCGVTAAARHPNRNLGPPGPEQLEPQSRWQFSAAPAARLRLWPHLQAAAALSRVGAELQSQCDALSNQAAARVVRIPQSRPGIKLRVLYSIVCGPRSRGDGMNGVLGPPGAGRCDGGRSRVHAAVGWAASRCGRSSVPVDGCGCDMRCGNSIWPDQMSRYRW